jgi:phosphotransferase system  glucose/maltose/N-acetylglucosamine-specific IIC component
MAKEIRNKTAKASFKKSFHSPFFIYWDKMNYILFGAGLLLLVIGFYVMSLGEWNSASSLFIAPIILFIAYVVVFPLAIFLRKKDVKTAEGDKVAVS